MEEQGYDKFTADVVLYVRCIPVRSSTLPYIFINPYHFNMIKSWMYLRMMNWRIFITNLTLFVYSSSVLFYNFNMKIELSHVMMEFHYKQTEKKTTFFHSKAFQLLNVIISLRVSGLGIGHPSIPTPSHSH